MIVKINLSNLQKAIISRTISVDTLKILAFRHYSIKTNRHGVICFLTLQKVRRVRNNEESVIARLTFYENPMIGQEKSVRCPH